MLFLVKLNELFFIWHHKSNTLIDLRTFINTFMHNNVVLRKQLSYFSWFRFLSLFLEGSPGFFNQKIKYLQISIFLGWQVCMPPKKKVKLNESPEINFIWADDGALLLLANVRNFKHKTYAWVRPCLTQQLVVFFLTLKDPFISKSCIEIKVELNFYFHTSLWCLKR